MLFLETILLLLLLLTVDCFFSKQNLDMPLTFGFSSSTCSRRKLLEISGTGFPCLSSSNPALSKRPCRVKIDDVGDLFCMAAKSLINAKYIIVKLCKNYTDNVELMSMN